MRRRAQKPVALGLELAPQNRVNEWSFAEDKTPPKSIELTLNKEKAMKNLSSPGFNRRHIILRLNGSLVLLLIALIFAGCPVGPTGISKEEPPDDPPAPDPVIYTVTFNVNGGENVPSQTVEEGQKVSRPADPTKRFHSFAGWYSGQALSEVYDFETLVTGPFTLYAGWTFKAAAVQDYLEEFDDEANEPVELVLDTTLSGENWNALLGVIASQDRNIKLDLSACGRGGQRSSNGLDENGTFNPGGNTGASKIVFLVLPKKAKAIGEGSPFSPAFGSFGALETLEGGGVETIGGFAFSDCTRLKSVEFPNAVSIDGSAFRDCGALEDVILPKAESIGYAAFRDCISLKSVKFPKVTSIGDTAFYKCTNLESADFPMTRSIASSVFSNCGSLKNINFPAVIFIANNAFSGCGGLKSADFPKAQSLGYAAFQNCDGLKSSSFPLVESIGELAFSNCISLEGLTLGGKPPALGGDVFAGTGSGKITVKVPDVSPYTASISQGGWGVNEDTFASGNEPKYGANHKRIEIAQKQ